MAKLTYSKLVASLKTNTPKKTLHFVIENTPEQVSLILKAMQTSLVESPDRDSIATKVQYIQGTGDDYLRFTIRGRYLDDTGNCGLGYYRSNYGTSIYTIVAVTQVHHKLLRA